MQGLRQKTKLHLMKSPIYSKVILQIVGTWAYLLANVLNKSSIYNKDTLDAELRRIETQVGYPSCDGHEHVEYCPLLTYSNHISCIDDPVLWGSLFPFTYYTTNTKAIRWSAAAVEICFSRPWHSSFFSLGKTFPIVRGIGMEQPGMEFAAAILRCNQWLHLFPEGRVMRDDRQQVISNKDRGYIFKWGVAKLILDYFNISQEITQQPDSERQLRILPFYHLGLDEVLPIGWPYIPRVGKQLTIFIKPTVIQMNSNSLRDILKDRSLPFSAVKSKSNDEISRIKVTNYLEEEMDRLIEPATKLHSKQP